MRDLAVGETVQVVGTTMTGNVGTIISIDEKRAKYLVLVSAVTQNSFTASELKRFDASDATPR